ncbi:adenylate/guanylate cyclase domain-containing protein [Desulfosarcina ovata]|uniref:Uncharacterized protein n=1 Tax=Desulfosarcina ovata subsp. ovata TaxID=2752305 RepID=A0A5K8AFH2_9BACT|nr:adenylate/guanylate cyclase domain-containing protein [Desulfosarcina ovata]BBO91331.1 hypothetical protein DSCOOX_45110 [Desulfosarcina ovata subsp. ovata]
METEMAQTVKPLSGKKNKLDPADANGLTVAELLARTGIAKKDLIRFIQLKVLPSSMIQVSPAGPDGMHKITAFSASILGHVTRWKQLIDQGHTPEAIAASLKQAGNMPGTADDAPSHAPVPPTAMSGKQPQKSAAFRFHLAVNTIPGSALLVDRTMHISWITVAPEDHLFETINNEWNDNPSGTVFDILLRASLKELVFDWKPMFAVIYRFLQATTPPETFSRLAPRIALPIDAIDPISRENRNAPQRPPLIDSCPICFEADGGIRQLRFYAMAVDEGTLCILDAAHEPDSWELKTAEALISGATADGTGTGKTVFSVLSARLDDSRHIVDTLLPETYFQLMTRIWDETDRIAESCGGQRAKRSGTDVQYLIAQHSGTDPAFDAIRCAVKLKGKIHEIETSLKADGGWMADIRLNIGISSGKDHLPKEDPSASMAFMLPGGAADQAFHLSAIANGGTILITKSAFGHLSARQMKRITFGVQREERLIPRVFTQLSDLPHGPDSPTMGQEIRSLFVTQIVDLKPDHAD